MKFGRTKKNTTAYNSAKKAFDEANKKYEDYKARAQALEDQGITAGNWDENDPRYWRQKADAAEDQIPINPDHVIEQWQSLEKWRAIIVDKVFEVASSGKGLDGASVDALQALAYQWLQIPGDRNDYKDPFPYPAPYTGDVVQYTQIYRQYDRSEYNVTRPYPLDEKVTPEFYHPIKIPSDRSKSQSPTFPFIYASPFSHSDPVYQKSSLRPAKPLGGSIDLDSPGAVAPGMTFDVKLTGLPQPVRKATISLSPAYSSDTNDSLGGNPFTVLEEQTVDAQTKLWKFRAHPDSRPGEYLLAYTVEQGDDWVLRDPISYSGVRQFSVLGGVEFQALLDEIDPAFVGEETLSVPVSATRTSSLSLTVDQGLTLTPNSVKLTASDVAPAEPARKSIKATGTLTPGPVTLSAKASHQCGQSATASRTYAVYDIAHEDKVAFQPGSKAGTELTFTLDGFGALGEAERADFAKYMEKQQWQITGITGKASDSDEFKSLDGFELSTDEQSWQPATDPFKIDISQWGADIASQKVWLRHVDPLDVTELHVELSIAGTKATRALTLTIENQLTLDVEVLPATLPTNELGRRRSSRGGDRGGRTVLSRLLSALVPSAFAEDWFSGWIRQEAKKEREVTARLELADEATFRAGIDGKVLGRLPEGITGYAVWLGVEWDLGIPPKPTKLPPQGTEEPQDGGGGTTEPPPEPGGTLFDEAWKRWAQPVLDDAVRLVTEQYDAKRVPLEELFPRNEAVIAAIQFEPESGTVQEEITLAPKLPFGTLKLTPMIVEIPESGAPRVVDVAGGTDLTIIPSTQPVTVKVPKGEEKQPVRIGVPQERMIGWKNENPGGVEMDTAGLNVYGRSEVCATLSNPDEPKPADPASAMVLWDLAKAAEKQHGSTVVPPGETVELPVTVTVNEKQPDGQPCRTPDVAVVEAQFGAIKEGSGYVSAQTKTFEPTKEVTVTVTDYYDRPVQGLYLDALHEKDDTSLTVREVDGKQKTGTVTDSNGEAKLEVKLVDLFPKEGETTEAEDKPKLRLVAAYENKTEGMVMRTAGHQDGDVLHIRTEPIELDSMDKVEGEGGGLKYALKFDKGARDNWEFPGPDSDEEIWQEQALMGSVIWNNLGKAKAAIAGDLGSAIASNAALEIRLLPRNSQYSYAQDDQLFLSHKVWKPRSEASYSPHTELHEFSHWALHKMGLEKSDGRVTLPTHRVQEELEVPFLEQDEAGACGSASVQEVILYFERELFKESHPNEEPIDLDQGTCKNDPLPRTLFSDLNAGIQNAWSQDGQGTAPKYEQINYWTKSGGGINQIKHSLQMGAPVVYFSDFYEQHALAIVGYDPKTDLFKVHDTDVGEVGEFATKIGGESLTSQVLIDHANYPDEKGGPGYPTIFAYTGTEPIFGGGKDSVVSLFFQELDAAHYGYLNDSTSNSLMEGLAIYLAVELGRSLNLEPSGADWAYRNEVGSVLYYLPQVQPAFVTFGPYYKKGKGAPDIQGEGWSVASLAYTLVNGLTWFDQGFVLGGTNSSYPWLRTPTIAPITLPSPIQRDLSWLVANLRDLGASGKKKPTVADLRNTLVTDGSPVSLKTIKKDGTTGSLATTDVDLLFGLFGFFTDKTVGNWKLDSVDFGKDGALGQAGNRESVRKITVQKLNYGNKPVTYTKDFPAIAGLTNGRSLTKAGDTREFSVRASEGSMTASLRARPERQQPLERTGSTLTIASDQPEVTMYVEVLVNEPVSQLSYRYEQRVATNEPIPFVLPYPTYGSLAVIRFEGSDDWLTIDSSQYWTLMGSETPALTLASKTVEAGGQIPSVESVLAAAGYSADGRPLDQGRVTIASVVAPPASSAQAVGASPAPAATTVTPSAQLTLLPDAAEAKTQTAQTTGGQGGGTTDQTVTVAAGQEVTLNLAGMSGTVTATLEDGTQVASIPAVGDSQTVAVTIPDSVAPGDHVLAVTDTKGARVEIPVKVQGASSWLWWGVIGVLLAGILLWLTRRRLLSHGTTGASA